MSELDFEAQQYAFYGGDPGYYPAVQRSPVPNMFSSGMTFGPMASPPPPVFVPNMDVPFLGTAGGVVMNLLASQMFGKEGGMMGGMGVFSPMQVMAGQRYYQNLGQGMGLGTPNPNVVGTLDPVAAERAQQALFNAGKAMRGGDSGLLLSDMKKIDDKAGNTANVDWYRKKQQELDELAKKNNWTEENRRQAQDTLNSEAEGRRRTANLNQEEWSETALKQQSKQQAGWLTDTLYSNSSMSGQVARQVMLGLSSDPTWGALASPGGIFDRGILGMKMQQALTLSGTSDPSILGGADGKLTKMVADSISKSMRNADGTNNYEFTRGMHAGMIGDIGYQMAARGMTFDTDIFREGGVKSYTQLMADPKRNEMMAKAAHEQLKKMTPLIDELREIFGADKTVDQLMRSLDAMTGGAIRHKSVAEVKTMARDVRVAAEVFGVTAETAASIAAQGALAARAQGLYAEQGSFAAIEGMKSAGAAMAGREIIGQYWGSASKEEMQATAAQRYLDAQNSEGSRILGGIGVAIRQAAGGTAKSTDRIQDILKSGAISGDAGAQAQLSAFLARAQSNTMNQQDVALMRDEGTLSALVSRATGMAQGLVGTAMANPGRAGAEIFDREFKKGLGSAIRSDIVDMSTGSVAAIVNNIAGRQVGRGQLEGLSRRLTSAMFETKTGREDARVAAVQEVLAKSGIHLSQAEAAAMASQVATSIKNDYNEEYGTSLSSFEGVWELHSKESDEIRAKRESAASSALDLDEKYRSMGVGRGTVMSRVLEDLMTKDVDLKGTFGNIVGMMDKSKAKDVWTNLESYTQTAKDIRDTEEAMNRMDPRSKEWDALNERKKGMIAARDSTISKLNELGFTEAVNTSKELGSAEEIAAAKKDAEDTATTQKRKSGKSETEILDERIKERREKGVTGDEVLRSPEAAKDAAGDKSKVTTAPLHVVLSGKLTLPDGRTVDLDATGTGDPSHDSPVR